jgi:hypothetical protein
VPEGRSRATRERRAYGVPLTASGACCTKQKPTTLRADHRGVGRARAPARHRGEALEGRGRLAGGSGGGSVLAAPAAGSAVVGAGVINPEAPLPVPLPVRATSDDQKACSLQIGSKGEARCVRPGRPASTGEESFVVRPDRLAIDVRRELVLVSGPPRVVGAAVFEGGGRVGGKCVGVGVPEGTPRKTGIVRKTRSFSRT